MRKIITAFLACFILTGAFAQSQNKISAYLQAQYSKTIYDRTAGNNPWGMGTGLQLFLGTRSKFKPTIDFTADAYLEDDKVLRINPDDTPAEDIGGVFNLFAGVAYHSSKTVYFSIVGGPSFVNGRTLPALKPSFGFYFSETKKWTGKISYTNVFNRDELTKEDFGSISFSIGCRLF